MNHVISHSAYTNEKLQHSKLLELSIKQLLESSEPI